MKSIIDELFNGNIQPLTMKMTCDSEYQKIMNNLSEKESKLSGYLNVQEKDLLNELMNDCIDIQNLACRNYYKEGVKFGIKLITDIFYEKNET